MAANSTVTLVIATQYGKASELVGSSTAPHQSVNTLRNLLAAASIGDQSLSIDAYSSQTAPVAATGTCTLTYASIANNDTVTIGGVVYTCVTGTPSGAQFKKVTDGPTTATNLAAAINADAVLGKVLTATAASGVVTVTANEKGLLGNLVTTTTSNGTGFVWGATALASGAGGAQGTAATYRLGL